MRVRLTPRSRFWRAGALGFRGSGRGAQTASPPLAVRSAIGLGDELLVNGNFATDTAWTHSAQWVLGGFVAVATVVTVTDDLVQPLAAALTATASYQVTFTLTGAGGGVSWKLANGQVGTLQQFSGTYTEQFQAGAAATDFRFVRRGGDFTGTVSAASLKRIL